LKKLGDTCPTGQSTQQVYSATNPSATGCVDNTQVLNSVNCYKFISVNGNNQCGVCDQGSSVPNLVPLTASGIVPAYWGCGQVQIPNIGSAAYVVKSSKDASGYYFITDNYGATAGTQCALGITCTAGNLAIPSATSATNDISGCACVTTSQTNAGSCGVGAAAIQYWQVVGGVYQVGSCGAGYTLINLTPSGTSCIKTLAGSISAYYDANCLTYQLDASNNPICQTCKAGYTPASASPNTANGIATTTVCLNTST
jgi:hypothetical protein